MPGGDYGRFLIALQAAHPWLDAGVARHYARNYGTRAAALLDGARTMADLGRHWGGRLYEREAEFLRRTEWAETAQDILTRRTKHYLHMTDAEQAAFAGSLARAA